MNTVTNRKLEGQVKLLELIGFTCEIEVETKNKRLPFRGSIYSWLDRWGW